MSDGIVLWILSCILCNVNSDWTCAVWTIDDSCRVDIFVFGLFIFFVSSPRVKYCELYLLYVGLIAVEAVVSGLINN